MSSGHDRTENQVRDVGGNVVQSAKIDNVSVESRDRRTVPLLALLLVVLLAAAAVIVWVSREPDPAGKPLASVSYSSVNCRSGYVVAAQGQTSVPYAAPPAGGVAATGGQLAATLQALSAGSVVLQSMRAEVLARRPALPGLYLPSKCASEVPRRFFAVDLSAASPVAVPVEGQENGQPVAPRNFPLKVGLTDIEQLVVRMDSPTEDVDWVLWVRWTSGSDSGELRLDDNGKPFRTTAVTVATKWCVNEELNEWRPTCG